MAKSIPSPAPVPSKPAAAKPAAAAPMASTPIRNSAVPPRPAAPVSRKGAPSHEQIARRAYEISQSGKGGSQDENWYRAERELRGI